MRIMPKTWCKKKQLNPYEITRATVKQLAVIWTDDEEDNYVCSQCNKFFDQVLQCECCSRWYCCSCQSISDKLFAALVKFNSLHWYCGDCEPSVSDLKVTVPQQDQQCDIEQCLQAMKCKLTDLTNSINKISSGFCLGTVSPQTNAIPGNTKNLSLLALRAVDEYRECEQHKLNLIFHKVPESTHSDPPSRREQDVKFIHNVVGVDQLEITNIIHLGQLSETGTRLQSKRQLLFKAKNLCQAKSDQLWKVFITSELSPQGREYQKNLRAELHKRRTAEEQNLVIHRGQIVIAQAQVMDVTQSSAAITSHVLATSETSDQSE